MLISFCIQGSEIINQGIELQTDLGANAQDILLRGEAIPEDVCAKVLLDKISSPEVAHHGKYNRTIRVASTVIRMLTLIQFAQVRDKRRNIQM